MNEIITKLRLIEEQIESLIKSETGATVEVTIRDRIIIYTEDLLRADAVKNFMIKTQKAFLGQDDWPADKDGPAAILMVFSL